MQRPRKGDYLNHRDWLMAMVEYYQREAAAAAETTDDAARKALTAMAVSYREELAAYRS